MDRFFLATIDSNHAENVTELRSQAYRRRYGDRADIQRLAWNPNDERFLNIGLIRQFDEQLVSVLRLAFVQSSLDFEKVVLLKHQPDRFELPLVVLGRGATHSACEGQGLHGVLRWAALRISKLAGAKSVVGTMEEGSLRLKQMAEIGYEFSINDQAWNGFLKNEKPIVVGKLRGDHRLDRAVETLKERFEKREVEFKDFIDYSAATAKLLSTRSFAEDP